MNDDAAKETSSDGPRGKGPRVVLGAMVLIAVLLGLFAVSQALRSPSEPTAAEPAAPRPTAAPRPGTSATQSGLGTDSKGDSANVLPGVTCGTLDGGKLSTNGSVFLWGWAYDPRSYTPAVAVVLLDNGRQLSPPIRVFRERPDVVAYKKSPQLLTSGWNVSLSASQLTGDEHVFEAFAILSDQKRGRLGGKVTISTKKDQSAASP